MKELKEYISEQLLLEMAQVGEINKSLTIYVRSNDPGNVPHFHVVDKSTLGNHFHTCVQIESNKYFHHTGKEGILNSKERKLLVKFLSSMNDEFDNLTNYQVIVRLLNMNNSSKKIKSSIEMPNYSTIKDNK